MKRFHLHLSVENLNQSIQFYSTLFAQQPTVLQADYAKWMLEDPCINFAISARGQSIGVNHLGFQVDSSEELRGLHAQLQAADARLIQENNQPCCYAKSDKYWVTDPSGIAWETFLTLGSIPLYGEDTQLFAHGASTLPTTSRSECCVAGQGVQPKAEREDCCGGPAAGNVDACCASDGSAQDEGKDGCGCGAAA